MSGTPDKPEPKRPEHMGDFAAGERHNEDDTSMSDFARGEREGDEDITGSDFAAGERHSKEDITGSDFAAGERKQPRERSENARDQAMEDMDENEGM